MTVDRDAVASIERSVLALRRRQRRRTLAGETQSGQVWAAEVADAIATRDGATTVADVAHELGIDPSQASRRVAAAVDAGLVKRSASQHDGRVSLLRLTPRGARVLSEVRSRRQSAIDLATRAWPPADRARLALLLQRFVRDLDRPRRELPAGGHHTQAPNLAADCACS